MAEINQGGGGGKHKGKKRAKKMSTKIDFTPMVDLAFLLITFFMLTTTLAKPKTMELNLPDKDKPEDTSKVKASTALVLILSGNNRIFYYSGLADTAHVAVTNFSPTNGVRKLLIERNSDQIRKINILKQKLQARGFDKDEKKNLEAYNAERKIVQSGKNTPVVLIKSDDKAKYKNLVDILDEMNICSIGKYALVNIDPVEKDMIKAAEDASANK